MSLDTNLHGRLRNTILTLNNGLVPLFEAVVNGIHAVEEGVHGQSCLMEVLLQRILQDKHSHVQSFRLGTSWAFNVG